MDIVNLFQKLEKIYGSDIKISELITIINNRDNYIDIYTDGSSYYDGIKRYSGIGVFFGDNDKRNVGALVGDTNNNESEILACIEALKIVKGEYYFVNIYTDSRLVTDGMNKICSITKFYDLFEQVDELANSFIKINWFLVKGHIGIYGNEKADELSRQYYKEIKK